MRMLGSETQIVSLRRQLRVVWMVHVSRCCLTTITIELLYILSPSDMKRWAKISKLIWDIYDEHEREEEVLKEPSPATW